MAHFERLIGRRLTVLSETGTVGRAADFTLVRFDEPVEPGAFLPVEGIARTGDELLARRL
ncbi:MAG: hypothetical protein LBR29_11110 [Methylobacteriaceae bacterium]|nr:hypothetical protein [Methylobacteriaceae bacterium]